LLFIGLIFRLKRILLFMYSYNGVIRRGMVFLVGKKDVVKQGQSLGRKEQASSRDLACHSSLSLVL